MTRITSLDMSMNDMLVELAEGNPGALTAMINMIKAAETVDPDSALGAFGPVIAFDSCGIYGPRIWMLYKDVCKQDVTAAIGMLRAVQMGILPSNTLLAAIDGVAPIDVDATLVNLRRELPRFGAADIKAS